MTEPTDSFSSRSHQPGILDYGFRSEIAETMIASCRAVMCEFGAVVGDPAEEP